MFTLLCVGVARSVLRFPLCIRYLFIRRVFNYERKPASQATVKQTAQCLHSCPVPQVLRSLDIGTFGLWEGLSWISGINGIEKLSICLLSIDLHTS